jgi:hypothetical protein
MKINEIQIFEGSQYVERYYLEGIYLPVATVTFNY